MRTVKTVKRSMSRKSNIRRITPNQRTIQECDRRFKERLLQERGDRCEICGKAGEVSAFHILNKKDYPKLRWSRFNVLLVCWNPCHADYHDSSSGRMRVVEEIKRLRGEEYLAMLREIDRLSQKVYPEEKLKEIQEEKPCVREKKPMDSIMVGGVKFFRDERGGWTKTY